MLAERSLSREIADSTACATWSKVKSSADNVETREELAGATVEVIGRHGFDSGGIEEVKERIGEDEVGEAGVVVLEEPEEADVPGDQS